VTGAPPPVAVLGAGAVGGYYGAMLARAGVPVTMIGRPAHVEAMRRAGLRLTTAAFDERVPVRAETDAAAVADAALVLVCVKSTDTLSAAAGMRGHLAPGARVLSLQNGVDNAPRLEVALGMPVAPAVVYVATEMAGPGHVRHHGRGELVIPPELGPAAASALSAQDVVALFARAGVPVERSPDVTGALWAKLVLNCAYNALSAIADLPYGPLVLQPGIEATMREIVAECLAVARAAGIAVPGDAGESVAHVARTMPAQVSSTCQDLRRGKPSEIDHLNGHVAAEGERLGVAAPVNRALHALVKALEARRAG
jgi:2-dehydropantoate 2-reductase